MNIPLDNKMLIMICLLYQSYHKPICEDTDISLHNIINYILIRIKYFDIFRFKLVWVTRHTNFTLIGNSKNFNIGDLTFFNDNCKLHASSKTDANQGKIIIGKKCMFGPNCLLWCATHQPVKEFTIRRKTIYRTIKIGNNVWIGANSTIIGGVTIGSNSIIGCGSNVIRDVSANCIYAGNPAKFIKYIG